MKRLPPQRLHDSVLNRHVPCGPSLTSASPSCYTWFVANMARSLVTGG